MPILKTAYWQPRKGAAPAIELKQTYIPQQNKLRETNADSTARASIGKPEPICPFTNKTDDVTGKKCCQSAHADMQHLKTTIFFAQNLADYPLVYHEHSKQGLVGESTCATRAVHLGTR